MKPWCDQGFAYKVLTDPEKIGFNIDYSADNTIVQIGD